MKNKKKILHVISSLKKGGTEKYLISLLKETNSEYENVIAYYGLGGDNDWEKELNELGIKVIRIDGGNLKRFIALRNIIKKEKIDIVYSYTFYNSKVVLLASLFTHVKKRIVHSHRIAVDNKYASLKTFLSKALITFLATDRLACSEEAGKALFFHRKYRIINNGIDVEHFAFDGYSRQAIRQQLGVSDNCILLGTIGRIDDNKNQILMLRIIERLKASKQNCRLAIIGDGENREKLKEAAKKSSINNEVLFLGSIQDVGKYYSAFDAFLLQLVVF